MEGLLTSAGFGLGPLTDANRNKPRLTPAVVKFYDLMLKYILTNPNGTAASAAEIAAKTDTSWADEFDLQTAIKDGLVGNLVSSLTFPRRYGLGDVAYLGLKDTAVPAFIASLPFAIHTVSLSSTAALDIENYPSDYTLGPPVPVGVFNSRSADALHFAAGACLAESVAELTRGPLRYALCLDGVLLWWSTEFANMAIPEEKVKYALYFNPNIGDAIEPMYAKYMYYNATGGVVDPSLLSVIFYSPVFLQGFSSFYTSNDPRYDVKYMSVGNTDIINHIEMQPMGSTRWQDVTANYGRFSD